MDLRDTFHNYLVLYAGFYALFSQRKSIEEGLINRSLAHNNWNPPDLNFYNLRGNPTIRPWVRCFFPDFAISQYSKVLSQKSLVFFADSIRFRSTYGRAMVTGGGSGFIYDCKPTCEKIFPSTSENSMRLDFWGWGISKDKLIDFYVHQKTRYDSKNNHKPISSRFINRNFDGFVMSSGLPKFLVKNNTKASYKCGKSWEKQYSSYHKKWPFITSNLEKL